mgnify:CR=1 FL=1
MTENTETPDIAALEAKMTDLEKKADTAPIVARLDKLEAKMNRPQGETKAEDEPSEERKAFANYLRLGDRISVEDKKALNETSDTQGVLDGEPDAPREDAHLLSLLTERIRTLPGVRPTETFVYLKLHRQLYNWGTR